MLTRSLRYSAKRAKVTVFRRSNYNKTPKKIVGFTFNCLIFSLAEKQVAGVNMGRARAYGARTRIIICLHTNGQKGDSNLYKLSFKPSWDIGDSGRLENRLQG